MIRRDMAPPDRALERVDGRWAERYARLADDVVAALGDAFDGGAVEAIAHVGGTAVPGLLARGVIDVIVRMHSWPLDDRHRRALGGLGLRAVPCAGGAVRFVGTDPPVDLRLVAHDAEDWLRHLALRDHLRAEPDARRRYGSTKARLLADHAGEHDAYEDGKDVALRHLEREALAWWVRSVGFGPLIALQDLLEGLLVPWAVGGGWALDLWSGAPSRPHDDVDVVVDRADAVEVLRHLLEAGYRPALVDEGRLRPWRLHDPMPSTIHLVRARVGDLSLDLAMEPRAPGTWLFRRDPSVRRPLQHAVRRTTLGGRAIAYLAPEVVLLFKARTGGRDALRTKDDGDASSVVGALEPEARAWLLDALERTAPGHAWTTRFAPGVSRRS